MKLPPGYVPGLAQQHKATAKGGFGERLLKQLGWSEGKGLGLNEDGMAEALRVKQKKDQTGVGAHTTGQWRDKWWEDAYAQSVSTITGAEVDIEKLNSDSSDSDSSDSDDSVAEVPTGGPQRHADGTLSSATAAEAKLAAQLAKDPWGRFGGRQGKMARIRAQEEAQLAAMAAKVAASQPAADAAKGKRKKGAVATEDEAAQGVPKAKRKKGSKISAGSSDEEVAPAVPARRLVVVADPIADKLSEAHTAFQPTPATGWWGAKRFTSAGAMGATGSGTQPAGGKECTEFTEDTQENLYMALHNAKSSGKTGLGKGRGSGIVGGAKWEGSKVSFDDAEAAEGGSEQTTIAVEAVAVAQGATEAEDEAPSSPPAAAAKRFPFNKCIKAAVQQAEGKQLTIKALCKVVKQQWAAKHGTMPASDVLKSQLLAKAAKLDGVDVKGKRIVLA